MDRRIKKILCIGEEWRGSNASGFFLALSRLGYAISIVNELNFVSVRAQNFTTKIINRLVRSSQINDFNDQAQRMAKLFQPSLIFVYKGAYLKAETINVWKSMSIPVVNFFPDVSFTAHGGYIPQTIPLYDHIFTTKTFGANDLGKNFGISQSKISFLPHGFDPLIHHPLDITDSPFLCEASFIGNYSDHKHKYLHQVKKMIPELDFKIWGNTWKRHHDDTLMDSIQGSAVEGDLYALAIGSSKINIALLSEQVPGASMGDQITSRTFHIPGAGGFMLHQRTNEVLQYFKENEEMACFESADELVDKLNYYLKADHERESVREKGYHRALADHSLDRRASSAINILKEKGIVN